MTRVRLIESREETTPEQVETFDHIAASRGGRMLRPYAAMLHRPQIARAAADLGAEIRYSSRLSDHDRELAILTTAIERVCGFERDAHRPLALEAGVDEATLAALETDKSVEDPRDVVIVDFVRSLCRNGSVADATFRSVLDLLGEEQTVELAAVVGFYTMLATFMGAFELC
jgi:4-carboxymuconolactone decarboxylase